MRAIDDALRIGNVMDRRDHSMLDAQIFVQHLHDRCETVGRARCGRDDAIFLGLVLVMIDPHHDVDGPFFHRTRDQNFFDTAIEIGIQALRGAKEYNA